VSPEVAVRGKILPASDIYSFGILLWEMYTGELIQDVIKDAPKASSKLTMGSWRPVFTDDCPPVSLSCPVMRRKCVRAGLLEAGVHVLERLPRLASYSGVHHRRTDRHPEASPYRARRGSPRVGCSDRCRSLGHHRYLRRPDSGSPINNSRFQYNDSLPGMRSLLYFLLQ